MSGLQALRRSIKGEKDAKPHNPIAPKSAVAIVPPKKVIRALYDYEAQSAQELSFSRGDFFHVIGRENDPDWYEACNPALPDARGLVPVAFFQSLGRTERDSAQSDSSRSGQVPGKNPDHDSGYAESSAPGTAGTGSSSSMAAPPPAPGMAPAPGQAGNRESALGKNSPMVYGIVMYDFQAERADELEAKAGEAIIVIAQSNPEWFVAKPIGRLGGPGLIPVSFVEIRDMASNTPVPNPQDAVRRAGIPKVEEWKKMAADYKNSSITLGKFEVGGSGGEQGIAQGMERMSLQQGSQAGGRISQNGYPQATPGYNSQRNTQQNMQMQQQQPQSQAQTQAQAQPQTGYNGKSTASQLFAPLSAHIPRYCYAEEKYWFVIEAALEDGRHWELSRYYEDFYDFQIALLREFPVEAGNGGTKKRTLPYMPGPVNYVTDAITEGRLHNLDAYVKNLLAQPPYIARCELVKQFFNPRQGDYEIDPVADDEQHVLNGSQPSTTDLAGAANMNGNGAYAGQQQPAMARQASSLSQPSQSSLSPGVNQQAAQAIKIKLSFNNELIAIRVPSDIQFRDLCDKIRDRLKISVADQMQLYYKDDSSGEKPAMISNGDLAQAMRRNEKLLVYVEIS
ncbi:bud emergence protein 1 [Sporothrix brasiliensis 5110]|uniref:Bud emergence protein 1 n=1 Tax=Sporothrix brasiliensis 5110 TaxID=1398154 RepID=A0A0C2II18_9PEZI|nr:bud emergence protein 1 [Sporothrix brasiliensis 5110]KIH88836.1 bud emergence protein 1 [Sporothrix brasiliensis 5110]